MNIAHVKRNDIDTTRWNQVLEKNEDGLLYADTNYLDLLAPKWEALILGDYEAIMPLPYRKKFGIRYLYPPPFVQQLGVIGGKADLCKPFINAARKQFKYGSVHLNYSNRYDGSRPCNNFVLDLGRSYTDIAAGFTYYLRRHTRDNGSQELELKESRAYQNTIDLYRKIYGHRFPHVQDASYTALTEFAEKNPDKVLVREAWKANELLSAVLCLKDNKRIYLLISVVTENGQKAEANRFLIDQLIREHAGQPYLLDFEGSDLPGVAAYYKGFGAVNQPYYNLHWNDLLRIAIG